MQWFRWGIKPCLAIGLVDLLTCGKPSNIIKLNEPCSVAILNYWMVLFNENRIMILRRVQKLFVDTHQSLIAWEMQVMQSSFFFVHLD